MPTQRQLTVAGLRTPLLEAGPAEAPEAVWFIHGNPGSRLDRAGRDVYMTPRFAYVHRQAFPSARVVELPDLGHFLLAEDPERVAEVVVPWLRERIGA